MFTTLNADTDIHAYNQEVVATELDNEAIQEAFNYCPFSLDDYNSFADPTYPNLVYSIEDID